MVLPPSRVGGDHTVESGDPIRQVEERPMKRWALSVPVDGFTLAEHGELAREAERLGFSDAWSLEVDGVDCFAPLAVVALTTRLRVGTAIANVYTRGPATLALSAAGIAVDGFRLTKPPVAPVPIHIAALRSGMLRVAGEVGDGAILNWLAADDVPKSVAVVHEAAARAWRDTGGIELTARIVDNIVPQGDAGDPGVRRL